MNFKFAAIGAIALTLTTCSTPALGYYKVPEHSVVLQNTTTFPIKNVIEKTLIEKQIIKQNLLIKNNKKISNTLVLLKKYVNKTWYVFSGDTPSGWDCSGLTLWFYKQMGISLQHRASEQQNAGVITKNPTIGDIVVFKYKGYKSAYHVGIYVSKNLMIHAPRKGKVTTYQSISAFAGKYSNISYVKILNN